MRARTGALLAALRMHHCLDRARTHAVEPNASASAAAGSAAGSDGASWRFDRVDTELRAWERLTRRYERAVQGVAMAFREKWTRVGDACVRG
jgi:hypothetical protein